VGELLFIGLGLGDERDLSPRARDWVRGAARVFAEEYTSRLRPGSLERLAAELGRPIERLGREAAEAGDPLWEALAGEGPVALLVVGDPFVATTHVALRVEAERRGHRWRYLPGATVLTAVPSLLGLMHYRFGRTVSLPFPSPGFAPTSPVEAIGRNRAADLHTLVLLDLDPVGPRHLAPTEALDLLAERDRADPPTLPVTAELAVVARAGTEDARAWWGTRAALRLLDFGPPLHSLVLPAPRLHFEEEAAVARWRVGPDAREGSPG
jgi:diphthine synthase